jgi:hypothetical protein
LIQHGLPSMSLRKMNSPKYYCIQRAEIIAEDPQGKVAGISQ